MYRLCLFDLDGTLLNTIHALTFTTNETLKAFGLSTIVPEQTKHMVGDGYKKQMERALIACGDEKLTHYEEALPLYIKNFERYCMREVVAYDGIPHLLDYLKKSGLKIAVYSNKPHHQAVENIETIFGKGYFDCVRGEQPGTPKKPAPDGAWLICRELGIEPKDCLYLGDTNTDMKTGMAAGMDTVGVTWGFREREELMEFHPRYIVDRPDQVETIIGGI
ncbi:MAG: HAD family hydrolase [Clostridium sp.]